MRALTKSALIKLKVKWDNGEIVTYRIFGKSVDEVRIKLLACIGGTKLPHGVRKQMLERFQALKK